MLLLVLVWLQETLARSLIYTAFTEETFSSTQDWQMSIPLANQLYTPCDGQSLLGRFGFQSWIMKNINLPPHHTVYIKFKLWRLGNWQNEKFILFYDQSIGFEEIFTQNGIKFCDGKTGKDQEIEISFAHEFQSILVIMKGYLNFGPNNRWWGIRNFQIEVDECIPGCNQCRKSDQRWECLQWNQVHSTINLIQLQQLNLEGWMIKENSNYFQKSNLNPIPMLGGTDLLNNNWEIFAHFDLPIHNLIKIKFRLAFINFLDDEYFYLKIDKQERLKGNHNLLEGYEYNSNPTNSFNFKTYELIFEDQSSSIEIKFFKDNLNQGALGINDFMIFVKTQGYCGDGFKSQEEECDDNNIQPFDGCFNCQYSCIENCKFCHQGICLECLVDYNLQELEQKCVYIQQTQFNEVSQINTCKRCQDSCSNQCSYCVKGECQCENDENQKLNQNCDDYRERNAFSSALQKFQEYKCHACELDCAKYCTECIQGYCFSCQSKFYLFEYECLPICGDGYIVDFEECDDQNLIPYDGCYNCKYQCPQNCQKCEKGICQECRNGFYLINKFCEIICDNQLGCKKQDTLYQCGNGILEGNESCDDGNFLDSDGCSKTCSIIQDYVCKSFLYSNSECTYHKWPQILAQFLTQSINQQSVLLQFSQQVKILDIQINQQIINSQLVDVNPNIYQINIQDNQGPKEELSNAQYLLEIQYFSQMEHPPLLKVQFNQNIYNQFYNNLVDNQITIKLQQPQYLDDEKQKISQIMKNANKYLIYSMGSLVIFNLLEGNLALFSGLLDILQQQSYLRYININFPLNLQIYFESSNLISLQPLLTSLKFQDLLTLILPQNYQECKDKFQFFELNADIFTNLQTQLFQIIIMSLSFSFSKIIVSLISLLKDEHYEKIGQIFTKLILYTKKSCFCQQYFLKNQGFQIFLGSNFYDLVFSSLLQIRYGNKNNLYFTSAVITSYAIISVYVMKFLIYNKDKFSSIHYILKFLFLCVIVSFQEVQYIQTILLNLIHITFLIQIIKFRKKISINDSIFLNINEASFFLFTFSAFLYWDELRIFDNDYYKKIIYGWIHIGTFVFVLIFYIGQQIILKLDYLIKYIRKNSKKVPKNANPWPLLKIASKS